jgi:hypothetical protein
MRKARHPLHLKNDTDEMKSAIAALETSGKIFTRMTEYHLKCGPYNFYPDSGRITDDRTPKMRQFGRDLFLELIDDQPRRITSLTIGSLGD